jgi:hypothetical protein
VNVFLIAVLRKNLPERALLYYWMASIALALAFAIPGASIQDLFGYDMESVSSTIIPSGLFDIHTNIIMIFIRAAGLLEPMPESMCGRSTMAPFWYSEYSTLSPL